MRMTLIACMVVLAGTLMPALALAAEMLDADQIRDAVSGHTVSGAMVNGGPYSEYFDADGTLRGNGYTGTWSTEGNSLCIAVSGRPRDCRTLAFVDGTLRWYFDGELLGSGTATPGNVHGY